jgi:hypothetical protein
MPRTAQRRQSYNSYIHKIVKQSKHEMSLTGNALNILSVVVGDIESRLAETALQYTSVDKKSTLGHGHVDAAVKVLLPRGLAGHARRQSAAAVRRYIAGSEKKD